MIKIIRRDKYIDMIKPYMGKNIIKVLTGQRRVGKSYLLKQIMQMIEASNPDATILYIDKEKLAFDELKNYLDLHAWVTGHSKKNAQNVVLIDEVQEIEGFEKALRDLNENPAYDIFITGSNAHLMSGDLSTLLAGRYVETHVHSLSYGEFLNFHEFHNSKVALADYLKYGGMPYLIHLEHEDEIVFDYLSGIYNSIILKDVVARHNIRNVNFLDRLILFLADNTGSLLSAKTISNFLKSQKVTMSVNTVMNYLNALTASFFLYKVNRYDIQGKKQFEINDKFYFEDHGLRNSIIGFKQRDMGKLLENIVYKHLRLSNYAVYVGKYKDKEIDFVAEKSGDIIYVQVAYLLSSDTTAEREFGNLLKIKDNYRKIVVTMDDLAQGNVQGIEHLHIMDFLLEFS